LGAGTFKNGRLNVSPQLVSFQGERSEKQRQS
jgi:hypothetical protein